MSETIKTLKKAQSELEIAKASASELASIAMSKREDSGKLYDAEEKESRASDAVQQQEQIMKSTDSLFQDTITQLIQVILTLAKFYYRICERKKTTISIS